MAQGAKVKSIDAIKEFRAYLTKFRESIGSALTDADSDVNKTQAQLEGEWPTFWAGQIRKRQEALSKAEEYLRQKQIFKDSTGSKPSVVEELKAVQIAKKNLAEALQKMANIKSWQKKLSKESTMYRGGVARFTGDISSLLHGIAFLSNTLQQLESYLGIAPEAAGELETVGAGGSRPEGGTASMARGTDQADMAAAAVDPGALRAKITAAREKPPAEEPVSPALSCGAVSDEQQSAIRRADPNAQLAGDGDSVAISAEAVASSRIYLAHSPNSGGPKWWIGAVESKSFGAYNIVRFDELRAARPDVAECLKLPADWLAIVDAGGLGAVYNIANENVKM